MRQKGRRHSLKERLGNDVYGCNLLFPICLVHSISHQMQEQEQEKEEMSQSLSQNLNKVMSTISARGHEKIGQGEYILFCCIVSYRLLVTNECDPKNNHLV